MEFRVAAATPGEAWVLPAPAKLNLFLHVLGRRDDGYHLLQTAFQLLDWGDEVTLRLRNDGIVRMAQPLAGVADHANLALQAAQALKSATGGGWGVDIAIDKRIPMGGGLGGASSDAATALVGLNALAGLDLGQSALAAIGLELGADVPMFVRGRSAWAESVGEQLTPIDLPSSWFVVLHPGVGVSTAAVFANPGLTRDTQPVTISCFSRGFASRNDLEPVAIGLAPEIGEALIWLAKFAPARMSGSGSCVFAAFAARGDAEAVASGVPGVWQAWVVRGVAESPLHQKLRAREKILL